MSWQSKLLNFILRLRRNVLRDVKQVYALRNGAAGLDARFGKPANTGRFEPATLGEFSMDFYYPKGNLPESNSEKKLLFFCHGGAYCLRTPNIYRKLLQQFCDALGCVGVLPDYRLAPEHPHPSGIDDCVAAYRHLLNQGYQAENIVMLGDSAGGGLTLSVLQSTTTDLSSRPAGAVLISPAGDWTLSGNSFFENEGRDPMFRIASFLLFRSIYLNGASTSDPTVSPVFGSFAHFPPLLVTTSSSELMRDTAVEIVRKAKDQGVTAELDIAPGLCHDYPLFGFLPEAKMAQQKIIAFCQNAFASASKATPSSDTDAGLKSA